MNKAKFTRYQFCNTTNKDFASTLLQRVNNYFKENELERTGNFRLMIKAILIYSTYIATFMAILFSNTEGTWMMFGLWAVLGLLAAIIGTAVMHDALHGTFSKNVKLNNFFAYSAEFLGVNGELWKIQHNVLHHSFTNIEEVDGDIDTNNLLRFTPHQKRYWFHRFQLVYAPVLYGALTIAWVGVKDFVKVHDFNKKGLLRGKNKFSKQMRRNIFTKVFYFSLFLVLPMIVLNQAWWLTLVQFVCMHFVLGLFLSIVFQTAHVMPQTAYVAPQPEPKIQENWFVHQLKTTSNFAMNNRLLSELIGGLNYQVEHHLFPNISHIHYPKISKIVAQTTKEFNIPYYAHKTFAGAIFRHFQHLYQLSKPIARVA